MQHGKCPSLLYGMYKFMRKQSYEQKILCDICMYTAIIVRAMYKCNNYTLTYLTIKANLSHHCLVINCSSSWLLAHLSRRLIGELIVYQWLRRPSSVRPSSVVRRPSSVNIFKHLLLWNYWANWTHISYGGSLGWGNESLFKWSWSHDQDGRHAHIW